MIGYTARWLRLGRSRRSCCIQPERDLAGGWGDPEA